MSAFELKKIKTQAEEAIKRAGKLFIETIIEKKDIEEKGFANYVTIVDYKVQEFLTKELKDILPDSNVITEESKENIYSVNVPTWIVDPVDGTTNLMYGFHHSAISVGLFIDGKPALGFIYNPTREELFTAEKGKGAFLNGSQIRTSDCNQMKDSLICFGTTPYDRTKADLTFSITRSMFINCRDVRRTGSAALDLAYIACGRLDGFFELTLQPWDFAAGLVILQEAGGQITDWKGNALNILKPSSVAASNGKIHSEMLTYF